jgi:hypothetical protein
MPESEDRSNTSGYVFTHSQIKLSDNYIVAGDRYSGFHCFDQEGNYLYTIETSDFSKKNYAPSNTIVSVKEDDLKGFLGIAGIYGNYCLYSVREENKTKFCLFDLDQNKRIMTRPWVRNLFLLDNVSMVNDVYSLTDTVPGSFLFTLGIKGDTLCRFLNYNPLFKAGQRTLYSPPTPDIYYYGKQLTIRQALNDTIFRVVSPNRLVPVYMLNFGSNRLGIETALYGDHSGNLTPYSWKESDKYVLFIYKKDLDFPNNRTVGNLKFFYTYFDKKSRQFYHFSEETNVYDDQYLMENPVPDALPFMLSYADITENQLRVCYSKKRLEEIINSKGFSSLPHAQQNKLETIHSELNINEVLIMILE